MKVVCQNLGGIMTASVGTGKIRPKVVTIPAKCRPRANSIVIPVSAAAQNIQLKTALTLKQDSLTGRVRLNFDKQ